MYIYIYRICTECRQSKNKGLNIHELVKSVTWWCNQECSPAGTSGGKGQCTVVKMPPESQKLIQKKNTFIENSWKPFDAVVLHFSLELYHEWWRLIFWMCHMDYSWGAQEKLSDSPSKLFSPLIRTIPWPFNLRTDWWILIKRYDGHKTNHHPILNLNISSLNLT